MVAQGAQYHNNMASRPHGTSEPQRQGTTALVELGSTSWALLSPAPLRLEAGAEGRVRREEAEQEVQSTTLLVGF